METVCVVPALIIDRPTIDRFLRACFRYALASDFGTKEPSPLESVGPDQNQLVNK